MFWSYFLYIIIILLILILFVLPYFSVRIREYFHDKYPENLIQTLILILSVFIGALLALQLTKDLNRKDEEQNYLSMLRSCKNMNERYLKNFQIISDSIKFKSANYSKLNRLIDNINQPFLLEEIIKNSDLYKYSSVDFRNSLPDIIFFMKEKKWNISKENFESFNYNNYFLMFLKDILTNEEKFIKNHLSEKQIADCNYKSKLKYHISTNDIPDSDYISEVQKKEFADSLNAAKNIK